MNTKRVILGVLCAAGAIGVSVWLALGYQTRVRLEEENQALRQQLDQMAELSAENERLTNLVAQASQSQSLPKDQSRELLRPRAEVGALRQQGKAPESLPTEIRQAPAPPESTVPTADYWPRASWAFAGYTNPAAALQTSLWAANRGDVKTFLASITGEAQKIAETLLASRSESEVAAAVMAQLAGFKSLRVLNREVRDENNVVLMIANEQTSGTETTRALMTKVGTEWKLSGYVP